MRSGESARRGIVLWILGVLGAIEPQKAIPLLPTALLYPADVAESVDATDLKSVSRKGVRVRSPPSAPFIDSARGARRRARAATGRPLIAAARTCGATARSGTMNAEQRDGVRVCPSAPISVNLTVGNGWPTSIRPCWPTLRLGGQSRISVQKKLPASKRAATGRAGGSRRLPPCWKMFRNNGWLRGRALSFADMVGPRDLPAEFDCGRRAAANTYAQYSRGGSLWQTSSFPTLIRRPAQPS